MRSVLAILIFIAAAVLVIFSQAQAAPPSCGSCGKIKTYEKFCGKLRSDLTYSFNEDGNAVPNSKVEICLNLADGKVACAESEDPLLLTSLNTVVLLGAEQVCMKVEASSEPRKIVLIQGHH